MFQTGNRYLQICLARYHTVVIRDAPHIAGWSIVHLHAGDGDWTLMPARAVDTFASSNDNVYTISPQTWCDYLGKGNFRDGDTCTSVHPVASARGGGIAHQFLGHAFSKYHWRGRIGRDDDTDRPRIMFQTYVACCLLRSSAFDGAFACRQGHVRPIFLLDGAKRSNGAIRSDSRTRRFLFLFWPTSRQRAGFCLLVNRPASHLGRRAKLCPRNDARDSRQRSCALVLSMYCTAHFVRWSQNSTPR
jgi:hypothetical protein